MRANIESLSQIALAMKVHVVLGLYVATALIYIMKRYQSNLGTVFLFSHVPILYYIVLALIFMITPYDLNPYFNWRLIEYILPTIAMLLASIGALCAEPGASEHSSLAILIANWRNGHSG